MTPQPYDSLRSCWQLSIIMYVDASLIAEVRYQQHTSLRLNLLFVYMVLTNEWIVNAAASLQDQPIKPADLDLKEEEEEEDAGPVNDAIVTALAEEEEEAPRLDDTNIINAKAEVVARKAITNDSASLNSQTNKTLTSASTLDDLNPSSIPILEKVVQFMPSN